MTDQNTGLGGKLALIQSILEGAFFSPLQINDWLGFSLGQPALLDLEDDEVFDIFVRSAIASETIYPEHCEGRMPMAWISGLPDSAPVLAHVLASLRFDRPLLFHRTLYSLPAVAQGHIDPEDFDMVEDFLQKALESGNELNQAAAAELDTVYRRGLMAAGIDQSDEQVLKWSQSILALPETARVRNDAELCLWLSGGDALNDTPPDLAPAVMVEVWHRWVGALLGVNTDLDLLGRMLSQVNLNPSELALYVPPDREAGHIISAECPFCATRAVVRLGKEIEQQGGCSHLVFVGTSDEVHLLEVVSNFDLGADFKALLASYYQSPPDLDLFATIINDLYEMLIHQGRLDIRPISCETAPKAFYYLQAYFAGDPKDQAPEKTARH